MEVSVWDFVSEYPRSTYKTIVTRFGEPQSVAESCIGEMETCEVLEKLKTGRRVLVILLATVTLIVLAWLGFVAAAYFDHVEYADGYGVVEVEIVERTENIEGGN